MIEVAGVDTYTHSVTGWAIVRVSATATGCTIYMSDGTTLDSTESRADIVTKIQNSHTFYTGA